MLSLKYHGSARFFEHTTQWPLESIKRVVPQVFRNDFSTEWTDSKTDDKVDSNNLKI